MSSPASKENRMTQYVYVKSEPRLWTVGFYEPNGKWHPESDHPSADEAANRVAWLNGAGRDGRPAATSHGANEGERSCRS